MNSRMSDVESEAMLLGQLFLKPELWYEISVSESHFTDEKNRTTYLAFKRCIADGLNPDLISVRDKGADSAHISMLSSIVGSPANWRYYESKILNAYRFRTIDRLSSLLKDSESVESAVSDIYDGLTAILSTGHGDKIHNRADLVHAALEQIEERYKSKGTLPGTTTGYIKLDNCILGWQPRRLYYVGARPSQGKSALLLNMADHLAMNAKTVVGFISIESSKEELLLRTLSSRGSIPSQQLATGMVSRDTFDKLTVVANDVYQSKFFIYDVPNQELSKIQAIARQMVEFHGCRVLFVDYLQKIRVQSKEERRDRVAMASTAMKDMSRQLDVPVIAAAQLRRDADNRQPTLGDFSDSSEIEKDADVAILLHPSDDEEDMVWAIVAKNRDGAKARVKLRFNRNFVRFEEASDERVEV